MISLYAAIPLTSACIIWSWFYKDAWRKIWHSTGRSV